MQQRLNEFVRLAHDCHDPSASLTYRQLGRLKQPKSRKRKRRSELSLWFGFVSQLPNMTSTEQYFVVLVFSKYCSRWNRKDLIR